MNQKGFANMVLVAVVVIIVGVAGYFAFVKKSERTAQQPTPTPTQTAIPTNTPITQAPKDETANWTTYKNDRYGIEFRHPADWKSRVLKEGDIDDIIQVFSPESYSSALKGDTDGPTDQFAVRILYNKSYESSLEGKNISFAGKRAIDGGWQNSAMGGSPLRIIKILVDPLVTIEMSAPSSNAKAIEEKILSTFKFTK